MKFRYPEQKAKNALRLTPVFLLVIAFPIGFMILSEYLEGPRDNQLVPIFMAIFALYFTFRAYYSVRFVFVFGDEESTPG